MKTIEIISQDVFDKIRSRFTNLQMGDETGGITMDPRQARFYDFDFAIEGHNFGRVSISINELGTLKVFYGQSILEDIDPISKEYWYDFLREMRLFAKRRLLRFDTRDITKSNLNKDDFQYLATNGSKEENMNMSESVKFEGSSKTSYGKMQKAKVIVKHHKPIEDESFGARKRAGNIKAIYVENEEGERFKYPFIHTAGALAMAQHVAHGGKPYDELGNAIIGMSEEISQCVSCMKHMSRHDGMHGDVHAIAERVGAKLQSLRDCLKSVSGPKGYRMWSENFEPIANGMSELDQATMEDYKSKFTVNSFKEEMAQYFPLIHRIMQETGTVDLEDLVHEGSEEKCDECGMWESECSCDTPVKEDAFNNFEDWAERLAEGQLAMDTVGQLHELLISGTIDQVGTDAEGIILALQGIGIDDENLEDDLKELAKSTNGAGNPADTIMAWLQRVDPTAYEEINSADAEQQQAPAPAPVEEPPVAEEGPNRSDVPAYLRKQQGEKPLTPADLEKEKEKHISHPKTLARNAGRTAEENEDEVHGHEEGGQAPSMKDLAQWVCGHYNANYKEEGFKSPWRKGVTELGIMAEKEFGPQYGHLVKELMTEKDGETALERVARKSHDRKIKTGEADEMQVHSQSPLSNTDNPHLPKGPEEGTDKFDPLKHVKNPTKGEKDAAKDVKRGSYPDRAAMLRSAEKDGRLKSENTDFDRILKLAGLAK